MPLSKHLDECTNKEPTISISPFYKFRHSDVSARYQRNAILQKYFR